MSTPFERGDKVGTRVNKRSATAPRAIGCALALALLATACGGQTTEMATSPGSQKDAEEQTQATGDFSDVEEVTLKGAMQQPPTGLRSEMLQWWGDEITERTGGKIKFDFYWAGSLVKPQDLLSSVEAGIADLGELSSSYDPTRTPVYQALDLPYNAQDYWCGTNVAVELARADGPLAQEMEKNGVVPLAGYSSGTFHLITADRVSGLDGIKGDRLRTFNDSRGAMWEKVGGEPIFLPLSELYEAVDRQVIAGAEWTSYLTDVLSMYEIIKSFGLTESGMVTGNFVLINKDIWASFPEKVKDVIIEVSREHDQRYAQQLMELEEDYLQKFKDEGVDVYELSEQDSERLRAAAEEAREEWLQMMEQKGHPVRETWDNFQQRMEECEQEVAKEGYPWE
jgi:TRAP-type C4-dicarboxylate transport system substrate-binding protein